MRTSPQYLENANFEFLLYHRVPPMGLYRCFFPFKSLCDDSTTTEGAATTETEATTEAVTTTEAVATTAATTTTVEATTETDSPATTAQTDPSTSTTEAAVTTQTTAEPATDSPTTTSTTEAPTTSTTNEPVTGQENQLQEATTTVATTTILTTGTFTMTPGSTCGVHSEPAQIERIVGGEAASSGVFRWQAYYRPCTTSVCSICGATLISNYWLVTAAHCMTGRSTSLSSVYLGSIYPRSGDQYSLAQAIIHENYNTQTLKNDIGLLKTSTAITFSDYVFPCCLPVEDDCLATGSELYVSGFGTLASNGAIADQLMHSGEF